MRTELFVLETKDLSQFGVSVEKYLPENFTPEILSCLSQELSPLTCMGFMRNEVTPELVADVSNHLAISDRVAVARDLQQKPIAFITASMKTFGKNSRQELLYHLEGIIVDPMYHGTGFSKIFLAQDVKNSGATFLGFHTQNGRMQSLGSKIANINNADSIRFADVIDTHRQEGVNDVGRYGTSSLYGNTEQFVDFAIANINWQQGDAMVCIGPVNDEILGNI